MDLTHNILVSIDNLNTFFTEGQAYLTFLDREGDKIKGLNLSQYLAHAYRIGSFDNQLILSGLTEDAQDYAVLKLDDRGQLIWAKTYGGDQPDHCFGMDLGQDGSIFLTGHTLSGTANWDTYTMKINSSGTLIWERKAGNPRGFDPNYIHDEAWGVSATSDGGCVVVAGTGDEYDEYSATCENGSNSNVWEVYLLKYDREGTLEWQKTYHDEFGGDWAGEDVSLTLDGGLIVAVDNGQFGFLRIEAF